MMTTTAHRERANYDSAAEGKRFWSARRSFGLTGKFQRFLRGSSEVIRRAAR